MLYCNDPKTLFAAPYVACLIWHGNHTFRFAIFALENATSKIIEEKRMKVKEIGKAPSALLSL
jgi:hypothetical protein